MSCTLATPATSTDIDAQSLSSAPESLDLDYDDWEGQFEFVGPSTSNATSQSNPAGKRTTQSDDDNADDDDDDLRLSVFVPNARLPILYDEETFLSLNANDFESVPHDGQLDSIADCRASLRKRSNLDGGLLLNNNSGRKFVSAKFHAEELNNIKNRLLAEEISSMKSAGGLLKANNQLNNNNNNEFAADLCDNLTEQVGGAPMCVCGKL